MTDAQASGGELVDAARVLARKGGFFPTPGAIVEVVREKRLERLRAERETEWQHQRIEAPRAPAAEGGYPPEGWAQGRSQAEVTRYVQDLVARGHRGREQGEMYVSAMLREEREGVKPIYGPSLVGGGDIGRALGKALTAPEHAR